VRLWDATTGQKVQTLSGHADGVWGVAYSPDGHTLASAGRDQTVRIWDGATGRELLTLRGHEAEVYAVAFSPDGRTLASAGLDRAVRIWDAVTGQEHLTLRGHESWVSRVAYSPDGRRLASASRDQTVRLWDLTTGQGILTLHGHAGWLDGIAFSPDGHILAAACWDGVIKIWDSTPPTPELQVLREARGLVEFLFAKPASTAEVVARIRDDRAISEPVRRQALALAEAYGRRREVSQAERVVGALFAKPMFRSEVLVSLRGDLSLSEPIRCQALALAEQMPEDPGRLNEASWSVVSRPDAEPAAYRLAQRRAETACRLIPHNGFFLATLGIAHYRMGDAQRAAATLAQSGRLNAVHAAAPFPHDLAFLALSQHCLGQSERARDTLVRLRETMKKPQWAQNPEAQAFLREAEALELDPVFPADPFAP
jgi:hypothetical protein